jgi:hypothetical protein
MGWVACSSPTARTEPGATLRLPICLQIKRPIAQIDDGVVIRKDLGSDDAAQAHMFMLKCVKLKNRHWFFSKIEAFRDNFLSNNDLPFAAFYFDRGGNFSGNVGSLKRCPAGCGLSNG